MTAYGNTAPKRDDDKGDSVGAGDPVGRYAIEMEIDRLEDSLYAIDDIQDPERRESARARLRSEIENLRLKLILSDPASDSLTPPAGGSSPGTPSPR